MKRCGVLAFLALSCAQGPRAVVASSPAAEPECSLSTPLQPGVAGSPGFLIPSDINPNGASELATLMRQMVADLESTRKRIETGAAPEPLWTRHRKMRCAWPTDLADRSVQFDALAQTYLEQVKSLDARRPNARMAFDTVLTACRACHEASCPGPIEKIEQLRLTASAK